MHILSHNGDSDTASRTEDPFACGALCPTSALPTERSANGAARLRQGWHAHRSRSRSRAGTLVRSHVNTLPL